MLRMITLVLLIISTVHSCAPRKGMKMPKRPSCFARDPITKACVQCYNGEVENGRCTTLADQEDLCELYNNHKKCLKCKEGYALDDDSCVEGIIDGCYSEFVKDGENYCHVCKHSVPTHNALNCQKFSSTNMNACLFGMRVKSQEYCVYCSSGISVDGICKSSTPKNLYFCALTNKHESTCLACKFISGHELMTNGRCSSPRY